MTADKKNIILYCGLIFFCLVFIRIYFIGAQRDHISILQENIAARRNLMNVRPDPVEALCFRQRESVGKVLETLPRIFSLTEHVGSLCRLIDENGLTVKNGLAFRQGVSERLGLRTYSTSVTVSGDYKGVKGFVADLQNFSGLIRLDNMVFSKTPEDGGGVDLKLDISIYFRESAHG